MNGTCNKINYVVRIQPSSSSSSSLLNVAMIVKMLMQYVRECSHFCMSPVQINVSKKKSLHSSCNSHLDDMSTSGESSEQKKKATTIGCELPFRVCLCVSLAKQPSN